MRSQKNFQGTVLFCLLALFAKGQDDNAFATWTDFNYLYSFNTSFGLGGDAGLRGVVSDPDWSAAYARPIFIYRNSDQLNFGFSVAVFQNFHRNAPDLLEFRPAQQVNLTWPDFPKWSLKSRLRFEERYLQYNSGESGTPAPGWKFRMRYELKFRSVAFNLWFIKRVYLLASGEYFFPLQDEVPEFFADQSRVLLGYGQELGQKGSYELHLIWQRTRHDFDDQFATAQYILRLRVFLRNERFEFVEED
jgi:hypothetical protein